MTRKTCFCHLIFKQTTPKDMQYNFMPDKIELCKLPNNTLFLSSKFQKSPLFPFQGLLEMKISALLGPICTRKSCQLNYRMERHERL